MKRFEVTKGPNMPQKVPQERRGESERAKLNLNK